MGENGTIRPLSHEFFGQQTHPSAASDTFLQTVITVTTELHYEDSSKEPGDVGTLGQLVP